MYGELNEEQRQALRKILPGRTVHDFGAGDCLLSQELLELGAEYVHAYDKHFPEYDVTREIGQRPNLDQHTTTFTQLLFDSRLAELDTVFTSWPPNNYSSNEIAVFMTRADVSIYLGNNFDGSACGTEALFLVMHVCELLAYVPSFKNNLLVVGKELKKPRDLTPEEISGLTMPKGAPIFSWDIAHSPEVAANHQLVLKKMP
jgi:hypothetical protein